MDFNCYGREERGWHRVKELQTLVDAIFRGALWLQMQALLLTHSSLTGKGSLLLVSGFLQPAVREDFVSLLFDTVTILASVTPQKEPGGW